MPRSRRDTATWCIVITALVLLPVLYVAHSCLDYQRFVPPANQTTMTSLVDVLPKPHSFELITISDENFIELTGPPRSLWTTPSGPSMYIFDETGHLIDWTPDAGDGSFSDRWNADARRPLTLEQAQQVSKTRE